MKNCFLALCALVALASATTPLPQFCATVGANKPSFCTCTDKAAGFEFVCTVPFAKDIISPDINVIGTWNFEPCKTPEAQVGYKGEVTIGTDKHTLTEKILKADGTETKTAIPGASKAGMGMYLVTTLKGNAAAFEVTLGLDACASIFGFTKCGSSIPNSFFAAIKSGATNPFVYTFHPKKTYNFNSNCPAPPAAGGTAAGGTAASPAGRGAVPNMLVAAVAAVASMVGARWLF